MSDIETMRGLFNRWERVWHGGEFDLVPTCLAPQYIRHDELGDRTVSSEQYAGELAQLRQDRPDIRIMVYDHAFSGDRAWYRFTMRWTEQTTGDVKTRAAIQSYRAENGRLAETWVVMQPVGSAWPDSLAQETWTSHPPA